MTTVFGVKNCNISREAIGFKLEENANQISPSCSRRPWMYLHFYLHPELTCKTPNTWPHLTFYPCQACLHLYSLPCEAVGEPQPGVQKRHSAFSPAGVLIPTEMQDWPGKQYRTDVCGFLFWVPPAFPNTNLVLGFRNSHIFLLKPHASCSLTKAQDVCSTSSEPLQ